MEDWLGITGDGRRQTKNQELSLVEEDLFKKRSQQNVSKHLKSVFISNI